MLTVQQMKVNFNCFNFSRKEITVSQIKDMGFTSKGML